MNVGADQQETQVTPTTESNKNLARKFYEEFISPLTDSSKHSPPHHQSVIIQRTPREIAVEIFRSGFMEAVVPRLRSFTASTHDKSSWVIQYGPESNQTFGILTLRRNSMDSVSWRFDHREEVISGSIQMSELPGSRGTLVNVISSTELPHDSLTKLVKNIFINQDEYTLQDVVKRFKSVLETGQVSTTVGQTHGNKGKES